MKNKKQQKTVMVTITNLPIDIYEYLKQEVTKIKRLKPREQTVPKMLKILAENYYKKNK